MLISINKSPDHGVNVLLLLRGGIRASEDMASTRRDKNKNVIECWELLEHEVFLTIYSYVTPLLAYFIGKPIAFIIIATYF